MPNNATLGYTYDGLGRRIRETDQFQRSTLFSYDAEDRDGRQPTGCKNASTTRCDLAGQLIRKILPGPQVTTYTYDSLGNLTSATDPLCRVVEHLGLPEPPHDGYHRGGHRAAGRATLDAQLSVVLSIQPGRGAHADVRQRRHLRPQLRLRQRTQPGDTVPGNPAVAQLDVQLRLRRPAHSHPALWRRRHRLHVRRGRTTVHHRPRHQPIGAAALPDARRGRQRADDGAAVWRQRADARRSPTTRPARWPPRRRTPCSATRRRTRRRPTTPPTAR
ncbi:MAG: RHS repeat protein [Planctomycetes bacterium]|nr:RHS repeat protein [Planctomycetota bacterium]